MLESNFWQDKLNSMIVVKEKKLYESIINSYNETSRKLKDLNDLNDLAVQENNKEILDEVFINVKAIRNLAKKMK